MSGSASHLSDILLIQHVPAWKRLAPKATKAPGILCAIRSEACVVNSVGLRKSLACVELPQLREMLAPSRR